jgi:hypothetical protein
VENIIVIYTTVHQNFKFVEVRFVIFYCVPRSERIESHISGHIPEDKEEDVLITKVLLIQILNSSEIFCQDMVLYLKLRIIANKHITNVDTGIST